MPDSKPHDPRQLTQYAFGYLSAKEQTQLTEHLRTCAPCREYVSFLRAFKAALREAKPSGDRLDEPCPDSRLIVALEAGDIDERTAEHVRAHLIFCSHCRKEYYALQQLRPRWTDVILGAARKLLWGLEISGTGDLLEPAYVGVPQLGSEQPGLEELVVSDSVTDPETEVQAEVRIAIEATEEEPHLALSFEIEPPQSGWDAHLFDPSGQTMSIVPMDRPRASLATRVRPDSYRVEIRKGEALLAGFGLIVRAEVPSDT